MSEAAKPPAYDNPGAGGQQPPPMAGPPPTVLYTTAPQPVGPIIMGAPPVHYGRSPATVDCQYCHAHVTTRVTTKAGAMAWIIFGVCLVAGFFLLIPWCLCWIPFVIDGCLDMVHSCPNCNHQLATCQAGSV